MPAIVIIGQVLTGVLLGLYVLVTGILLMTWAVFYHEPGKDIWDVPAILLWPALAIATLVRWSFTGKWRRDGR